MCVRSYARYVFYSSSSFLVCALWWGELIGMTEPELFFGVNFICHFKKHSLRRKVQIKASFCSSAFSFFYLKDGKPILWVSSSSFLGSIQSKHFLTHLCLLLLKFVLLTHNFHTLRFCRLPLVFYLLLWLHLFQMVWVQCLTKHLSFLLIHPSDMNFMHL